LRGVRGVFRGCAGSVYGLFTCAAADGAALTDTAREAPPTARASPLLHFSSSREHFSIDMLGGFSGKNGSVGGRSGELKGLPSMTFPKESIALAETVTVTSPMVAAVSHSTAVQRLTLVHFSAQRKLFVWDRGFIQGLFRGCSGGVRGYLGVSWVCLVSETAQVELNSERV